MKPTALALTVAGVAILAAGIWTSLVLPIRKVEDSHATPSGGTFTGRYYLNVWGRTLSYSHSVTYATEEQKPHGEGFRPIPDESTYSGSYDPWSKRRHGLWSLRTRLGTEWKEATEWYIHGDLVTREKWERT